MNKKAGIGIWVIIAIIIIAGYLYHNYSKTSDLPTNENNSSVQELNNSISSKINTSNEDLISGTNYSCEDIIPQEINIYYSSTGSAIDELGNSRLSFTQSASFLSDGNSLSGDCKYNTEVGQKASAFSCEGSFILENNRISETGIIRERKPRKVTYSMTFDDSSCAIDKTFTYDGNQGELTCKILSSSCNWKRV